MADEVDADERRAPLAIEGVSLGCRSGSGAVEKCPLREALDGLRGSKYIPQLHAETTGALAMACSDGYSTPEFMAMQSVLKNLKMIAL